MTEEDAKDHSCCGPEGCGATHSGRIDQWGHKLRFCVGSQCMAWRWDAIYVPDKGEPYRTGGYCGLARKS